MDLRERDSFASLDFTLGVAVGSYQRERERERERQRVASRHGTAVENLLGL